MNRVAASVVDAAIQARKEDVTRLVGRDGVAGAWEINTMVSAHSNMCLKTSLTSGNSEKTIRSEVFCNLGNKFNDYRKLNINSEASRVHMETRGS